MHKTIDLVGQCTQPKKLIIEINTSLFLFVNYFALGQSNQDQIQIEFRSAAGWHSVNKIILTTFAFAMHLIYII